MSTNPKHLDELAAIIGQSDFAEESAELVIAANWMHPDDVERLKTTVARVEALAVEAQADMDRANAEVEAEAARPSTMRAFILVDDLRTALAETDPDE